MARIWTSAVMVGILLLPAVGTVRVLAQETHDPPLLLPFPAGAGEITNGYEDGAFHTFGNAYSLDLCERADCTGGKANVDEVLAPTDLTYVWSLDPDGTGPPDDYHIFQIDETDTGRVCLALGHFDLTAPGTVVDGKRTFPRGEPLGTLLPYPDTVPHIHIGLWTVVKPDECAVSDDAHTKRTALAFTGAYELDGVEYRIGEEHYGKAVTSHNTDSGTSVSPPSTAVAPPVQWIEPVDGAKVGPSLQLSAWPTPLLVDGQLSDPTDVARVDFTASWSGGSAPACSATSADDEKLWSCTADLAALGVPAGPVELSFDVLRTGDSTLAAPDGSQTVTYAAPPTDPMKYLRAGIPTAFRGTCTKRTTELPPGTIAAVDCKPDASAIDAMAYYLLRPDDARAVWQERMAEYGLKPGGDCAKGKAGIQSKDRALSVGCYKNEYGYANLRLASSATCPAVYWALLGNTKDLAQLWKAYDRVAGEGWTDPGLGGRKDAPGCSGRLPAYAPPGPPEDVVAMTHDITTGLDAGMRRACQAAGIALKYPGSSGGAKCAVTDIRWSPAPGRVDRYTIRLMTQVIGADGSSSRGQSTLATVGPSVRSYRYVTMHGYSVGASVRYRMVVEAANTAGGSAAVARWPRSWVP